MIYNNVDTHVGEDGLKHVVTTIWNRGFNGYSLFYACKVRREVQKCGTGGGIPTCVACVATGFAGRASRG